MRIIIKNVIAGILLVMISLSLFSNFSTHSQGCACGEDFRGFPAHNYTYHLDINFDSPHEKESLYLRIHPRWWSTHSMKIELIDDNNYMRYQNNETYSTIKKIIDAMVSLQEEKTINQ